MATWLGDIANQALVNAMTIPPVGATTTTTGSSVDCLLAEGPLTAILGVGTVTGVTGTLNVKLQESTDGSNNWTDITGAAFAQVTTTPSTATAQTIMTIGKQGSPNNRSKRYARALATFAGTSPSFPIFVQLLAQKKILGSSTGAQTTNN